MYISYDKLWKLLIDKHLKKTDLIALCSISSRTLTKLSKNENVNTDTLIRICEALSCELDDICTLQRESDVMSFYDTFKTKRKLICSDEYTRTYSFEYKGREVILRKTRKKANRNTVIHCRGNSVTWEQITSISIHTSESEYFSSEIDKTIDNEAVYLFVISGRPNHIKGLDEGIFVSAHRKTTKREEIYVMSETALKLFDI